MATNSIMPGHGSRGTPSSGSRPDRNDDEQHDRRALPSGITAIALASVLLLVATVLTKALTTAAATCATTCRPSPARSSSSATHTAAP